MGGGTYGPPGTSGTSGTSRTGEGFGDGESRRVGEAARQGYSQAKETLQDTMHEAKGYVQNAVGQARDKVAEYREEGWGRVQDDVREYTRSQPLAALGMAAAVGLLLGWLSAGSRR